MLWITLYSYLCYTKNGGLKGFLYHVGSAWNERPVGRWIVPLVMVFLSGVSFYTIDHLPKHQFHFLTLMLWSFAISITFVLIINVTAIWYACQCDRIRYTPLFPPPLQR